jgi:hypothetical protein
MKLNLFDKYTRRARVYPVLLVLLPLLLVIISVFPDGFAGMSTMIALLAWAGLSYLFGNLGRDLGKNCEADLYEQWGGKPTIKYLRYRSASNLEYLNHLHAKLHEKFPTIEMPTPELEIVNPEKADNIYDLLTRRLIELTRDQTLFRILFNENCSYGFRRNVFGLKVVGVIVAVIGVLLGLVAIYVSSFAPITAVVTIVDLILLTFWVAIVNSNWVRIPAEAYAERLFASIESLE